MARPCYRRIGSLTVRLIGATGTKEAALFEKFRPYRTVQELEQANVLNWRSLSENQRRSRVSIGVIDDQPFAPQPNLERLGYRISFLGDPQAVDVVVPHHIVLCDLQGVGRAFGGNMQGAFFIDEIKKNHPEKIVIAYTGGTSNLSISREANKLSDYFLKKDATIEEWRDKLDEAILDLLDPIAVWNRQRMELVSRNIDTFSILKLEDQFSKSILEQKGGDKSPFVSYVNSVRTSQDIRAVVTSMIASGLYAILTGG